MSDHSTFVKRALPRSLFGRSILIILMPLIIVQAVTTFVFFDRHFETITRRLAQGMAGDILTVIRMIEQDPENVQSHLDLARSTMLLEFLYEPNAILPNEDLAIRDSLLARIVARHVEARMKRPFRIQMSYQEREALIDVQLANGVLFAIVPRERLFSATTYIFLLWMVGTSLVFFAMAMIFMRNQIRPIRRLASVADRFGKGLDIPTFKPEGATEVRRAAAAFNQMRARIERQMRQRTEMLAGVSHDLRTPLTRMKLQLAMISDAQGADDLATDVAELERMIEGYLMFARGEGTELAEETDLLLLLRRAVGDQVRGGQAVELAFSGHLADANTQLELPLRPQAFRRAITNFLTNADRYAQNTVVTITERRGNGPGSVEITIDDDGPGIPPAEREAVFRPFYRVDWSRNTSTGGVGLGLSIARDVVRGHGGDVMLSESPLGGLRVFIRLPK
ncbi:MAG: ATP-binding protein [Pseudomonadota bacterium]